MKKTFKSLLLTICTFTIFTITANASTMATEDIPNKSYLIGKALYTEDITLTTRHIMLGARTINSNDLNDMIIYYKNFRGVWVDGLTGSRVAVPTEIQIDYINMVSNIETYEVTFDTVNGSSVETQYVSEGGKATIPSVPTKPGYIFNEWLYKGEPFDFNESIKSDIELVASWTPITYVIAFDGNGADNETTEMDSVECTYGDDNCQLTANIYTREHYTFNGWTTTDDASEAEYDDEDTANDIVPTTNNSTVTLYAVWIPVEYTITYNGIDGATFEEENPTTHTIEDDAITLNQPQKDNYTFIGWTVSNGEEPQTEVTIPAHSTDNLTFTANWALNNYQITYNANGGTGEAMDNTNCTYNTNCPLAENTYTRENYIFSGWSLTSDGEIISNGTVNIPTDNSPITVYAIWAPVWEFNSTTGTITKYNGTEENVVIPETINNVNVTAIAEGAFESPAMRTLEFSQYITSVAPNAIKTYENTSLKLFMNTNQIKLYEADSIEGWPSVFGITQETISNHTSTAIGDEPNETVAYIEFNNINIYNIDFRYTITYEGIDEDTEVSNPTIFFEFSQDFTLTNPRKDGYTFAGWTSDNITITNPFEVTIPSGTSKNLTFTATWEEENNS